MNVEVQLRTIAMDSWASLEHKLRYKKEQLDNVPEFSKELRRCADMTAELDSTMENLRKMRENFSESIINE